MNLENRMPSAFLLRIRARYKVFIGLFEWIYLSLWSLQTRIFSASGCHLIRGTVTVERLHDILSEWDILSEQNLVHVNECIPLNLDQNVEITLTCQSSCFKGVIETRHSKGLLSLYRTFHSCRLEDLNFKSDVPIVVWFHGGGMVIGNSCDEGILIPFLLSITTKRNLIWLSVNYRLAPENPFPAAIIDGLSVIQHIIQKYPRNTIHVAGLSAGGNLSAVVGFETIRKFPDAIDCIVSLDPMLDPTISSPSSKFYGDSPFSPIKFLRYCWGSYLQLGSFLDEDGYNMALKTATTKSEDKLRLICPCVKLPQSLKSKSKTCILIKTSSTDSLRDDGLNLIKSLEELDASVHVHETRGSHEISILIDWRAMLLMVNQWSSLLWCQD